MFWKRKPTVHVEFVDSSTGAVFAQTKISPDQLPASFEAETTMHLGEQEWAVVSADPMTSAEFRSSGRLRLVLSRVKAATVDPRELLYSLPTISDALPAPASGTTKLGKRVLELHEDDWLQIQFYSVHQQAQVDAQVAAIREVHETARSGPGFKRVHVRRGCDNLFGAMPCSLTELRAACPAPSEWLDGIAVAGVAGLITDGFAVRLPSALTLYGLAVDDRVLALGAEPPGGVAFGGALLSSIAPFLRASQLRVVDWCRAKFVGVG